MLEKYKVILASNSPRRKELLQGLGISFKVNPKNVDENYPKDMATKQIPEYLAKLKVAPFVPEMEENMLVITADTIVCLGDEILGKPANSVEAASMLKQLSGKTHQVLTGVCILTHDKEISFTSTSDVTFKELSKQEIDHYINNFNPYDKAGGYGIQEWFGYIAVERINGSFFNVMGLPVHQLYEELKNL
ncbi:MAG: Maf-like protein [Prolixibacteraceae bacterium]|jgi:septum formation protein|nr:Maf-like protein [Prolixibacteraceae bacterium]